ncbi:hypothetical protein [Nitrosomonas oligotropha]|uniref:Uncharacterized protein n=1 Tax=Nitrosomonas oligotropha TaxID=42354 RepID=A0A1H8VE35_9PROT|nr:hypothetical protein [Nitrosomonas oligotropha]SDX58361.1 hypothetical protein SAMN05216300_1543 [Nitrosomonas oligotropha]SEP13649.1 hypothetical protein SAMN05216333_1533 [Nitrosomonas oligotropha]
MKIFNLKTIKDNYEVKLSVSIESEQLGLKELWFLTTEKYAHGLCCNRLDGFLVGMIFPAMQYGEDIHLEGCVSKKLLFNLNNYVIPLLMVFSPSAKQIKITADEISTERLNCRGVGTGFSGGVDSFCTIYDRYELEKDPDYKINSFLFLNVGSHGSGNTEKERIFARTKYHNRYQYLNTFPNELGLDFIPLDSNLHDFHPWGHQLTHSLTTVSGVLIMQNLFGKYYFASTGFSYLELLKYYEAYLNRDVAIFDPVLLPLLSTESLELIPDGTPYSRIEKIRHIVNYEPVHRYLNVCVGVQESHENCSVCAKCSRTLMTLDSIGRMNEFANLFDIKKYKKQAELRYVCQQVLLQHKDPFARASIKLAKENGVKLPSCLVCYIFISLINIVRASLPPTMIAKIKTILKQN